MNNMPTKIDFTSIKKTIKDALIPPDSQIKPKPRPVQARTAAGQKSATDAGTNKEPAVEVEVSFLTPGGEDKQNNPYGFTKKNLQEAIIWSEIIGEPVCKRRKRRQYGS